MSTDAWPPPQHFKGAAVPIPEPFRYEVAIHAASQEEADQVMAERLGPDEDYGFPYVVNYRIAPEHGPAWCAWCEEAQAPAYLAHEGHDPDCPMGATA